MIPLILMAVSGLIVARHAKLKGRNSVGWFIYGSLVPIISLIHVGVIKPIDPIYLYKAIDNEQWQTSYESDAPDQTDDSDTSNSYRDYGSSYEDYEKIRNEYLEAEKLKKEAEADREKARLARQEAEQIRQKAFEEWERIRKNMNASKDDMGNPYIVLGVHENDSFETIKDVYRKLVQIYHPDKHIQINKLSIKQKNDLIARINAAYDWVEEHHENI